MVADSAILLFDAAFLRFMCPTFRRRGVPQVSNLEALISFDGSRVDYRKTQRHIPKEGSHQTLEILSLMEGIPLCFYTWPINLCLTIKHTHTHTYSSTAAFKGD